MADDVSSNTPRDANFTQQGYGQGPQRNNNSDEIQVVCGPLLNYKYLADPDSARPVWHGSVLIVTKPGTQQPILEVRESTEGVIPRPEYTTSAGDGSTRPSEGLRLYADPDKEFWKFAVEVPLQEQEARWEYSIPNTRFLSGASARIKATQSFVVPAASESMRIMFHSCNGFSVGTDVDAWSGPALWNDVVRMHEEKLFHVMIGGGDQIYNDGVRVDGPLNEWTSIGNPHKRRDYPFGEKMRAECDEYYYQNYVSWYSAEPFSSVNAQVAQINIWDDHGKTIIEFLKLSLMRCRYH